MTESGLLWTVLFSSIGLGYFLYGRKQRAPLALACGLLLMGYAYFVYNTYAIVGIGIVLMAIPYFVRL